MTTLQLLLQQVQHTTPGTQSTTCSKVSVLRLLGNVTRCRLYQLVPSRQLLLLVFIMTRAGAVLFLSAMTAFLFQAGLPFVVVLPSRSLVTRGSLRCAGAHGASLTTARAARARSNRQFTTAMDAADVCQGDVPTPGWVRLAQRNLARISVGDRLPDVNVR